MIKTIIEDIKRGVGLRLTNMMSRATIMAKKASGKATHFRFIQPFIAIASTERDR